MRRWGQIAEPQTDAWFAETAASVYKPDIYLKAARMLVDEGLADEADFPWDTNGYKPATNEFIDGITYDGTQPNAYIDSLSIGLKGAQKVVGNDVQG
jgi:nitrate/nitrite transport system substrate-binding protein